MPGLPAVIALGQTLFGDPRLGIAVLQAVLYAGVVVLSARLAQRAFGGRASVWAAGCVGLNPALGYYAAQALTEFLTAVVLLGLIGVVCAYARAPRSGLAVAAGALIAAAAYLRAEYLGLAVVFALIVLWAGLRARVANALAHAVAVVVVCALVMAPWVIRYAV